MKNTIHNSVLLGYLSWENNRCKIPSPLTSINLNTLTGYSIMTFHLFTLKFEVLYLITV